jgi:hypothetical protein
MVAVMWLVIDQHSHWWGIEIIKLSAANRSHTCPQRGCTESDRDGQRDVKNTHQVIPVVFGDASVNPRTVRLLSGIKAAAINGVIHPVIANPTATML